MTEAVVWRTPVELVRIGFERGRLVLMNEAHSGLRRCVRTRVIGRQVLPAAHAAGVRHLAMEALYPWFADEANRARQVPDGLGYLAQPEMRSLIQAALDLGWTLRPYEAESWRWLAEKYGYSEPIDAATRLAHEAELHSLEYTNWREAEQARNLVKILAELPAEAKLLVWCGNGHLSQMPGQGWVPMGYHLAQAGAAPFAIDQAITVNFETGSGAVRGALLERYRAELEVRGGTAGWLSAEAPAGAPPAFGTEAVLLSVENELE